MEFRTIVTLPTEKIQLTPSSHVMLLGSCFSDHIGQRMQESLPDGHCLVNPNGVLYNPGSIFTALSSLINLDWKEKEETYFLGRDALWHNWLYSSDFSANTLQECQQLIAQSRQKAQEVLQKANVIFITLSTDHCYYLGEHCERDTLVANCHKEPAKIFTEATMPFEQILKEGHLLLQQLQEKYPLLKVIFTLSPYRYQKYGLHESQLSKAHLLHAIDEFCKDHSNALYFPAYEIIIDELRDYRFYATDMLHPSQQAVDYVWERLQEWAFSPELSLFAKEKVALLRDFQHRPLHSDSEAALRFFEQRDKRKAEFLKKYQHLYQQ